MKKITLITSLLLLISCGGAYDQNACLESVKNKFPECNIHMIAGEKYRFIVEDTLGFVYYVETMNGMDSEVSETQELFNYN